MNEIDEKNICEDDTLISEESKPSTTSKSWILQSLVFHCACIAFFIALWYLSHRLFGIPRPYGVNLISSPAREAVTYEKVLFMNDLDDWNVFKGEPNPELDKAWDDILKYRNLAIPSTALPPSQTSIPLLHPPSHLLIDLDVFHNLHCLNTIRKYIFRSHYPPSQLMNLEHINHCIDSIRQALQCHADISIGTYRWQEEYKNPWPDFRIEHECRNWDEILEWAKEHDAGTLKGNLIHPIFGIV